MKKLLLILISILTLSLTLFIGACDVIVDVSSIEFYNCPKNAEYEINGFDYSDFSLLVKYTNGSEKVIPLSEDMISLYDKTMLNEVGTHTIKIGYDKFSLSLDVKTVYKKSSIEETFDPKLDYFETTYDGQYHYVNVSGDLPGNYTVYYPNGNSYKNAGTYTCTAVVSCAGFETKTLYSQVVINKATYEMKDVKLHVDYGTTVIEDEEGDNPPTIVENKSFIYDGKEHSAMLTGSIPQGLSSPEYYIGLSGTPFASYEKGKTAVNAGTYIVYAIFTGDSDNYQTENLTITTTLIIDKKPISADLLDSIVFEDKEVTYDGKKHRLIIENIELPEGVTVEYVDENGEPFESRTEANEKGYLVTARFLTDNVNYAITNTKSARLFIYKASYITGTVNALIDGKYSQITYDGLEHQILTTGVSNIVKIKSITCEGENITSITNAGTYNIHVEFEPADENHINVDPFDTVLTINKTKYVQPNYEFNSLTVDYDGTEYSLNYIENEVAVGFTHTLVYMYDKDGVIKDGTPQNVSAVGTYTSYLKYNYNPINYIDAPESIDYIEAVLTINPRVYDAENIINLEDIRVVFEANKNRVDLCKFEEVLPSWIDTCNLIVKDPDGNRTSVATNAGEYSYQYEFWYFNGLKRVSALSKEALLKIIGLQIGVTDYKLTYKPSGAYDGTTSYLPNCEVYLDSSLNPEIITEYKFLQYDNNLGITVPKEEYDDYSVRAGYHKFIYTIKAFNYEPLKLSITIEVSRQTIVPSKFTYVVKDYTGVYDGQNHSNQLVIDTQTQNEKIGCEIKLTSDLQDNQIEGTDIGTYFYKVQFSSLDPNYVVQNESMTNYSYKVVINSLNVDDSSNYDIIELSHTSSTINKLSNTSETYTYNTNRILYDVALNYGKKISSTQYGFDYFTYDVDYGIGNLTSTLKQSAMSVVNLCFENDIFYLIYDENLDKLLQSKSLNQILNTIKDSGNYYIIAAANKSNITFNGTKSIAYKVTIKNVNIDLPGPKLLNSSTSTLVDDGETTFNLGIEGLSTMYGNGMSSFSMYNNVVMRKYKFTFDGSTLCYPLHDSFDTGLSMFDNEPYYACKSLDGLLESSNGLSAFPFNYTDGIYSVNDNVRRQTNVGIYYLFIDLGYNYTCCGNSRIVYKITVEKMEVDPTSFVSVYKNDYTPVPYESDTRLFFTEKNKLLYTLDGEPYTPITNADELLYTTQYRGSIVYSVNARWTYNDLYMYKFFTSTNNSMFKNERFNIFMTYSSLSEGGKVMNRNPKIKTLNDLSYYNLQYIAFNLDGSDDLYSTTSACGIYYLFVSFLSDNITVNNGSYFVICLKVDRIDDDELQLNNVKLTEIQLESQEITYRNTGSSTFTCGYDLSKSETVGLIRSEFGYVDFIISSYTDNLTDYKKLASEHKLTCDIKFDQETYAGLVLGMKDITISIKIGLNFTSGIWSNMGATYSSYKSGGAYQLDQKSGVMDDVLARRQSDIKNRLHNMIGISDLEEEIYNTVYRLTSNDYFDECGYKVICYSFDFDKSNDMMNCVVIENVESSYFSFNDTSTAYIISSYVNEANSIKVWISPIYLRISTGLVVSGWLQDVYATGDDITSVDNVINKSYLFMGYDNKKNEFLNSLPSGFDLQSFKSTCVTIDTKNYDTWGSIYVTLKLSAEFQKKYAFKEYVYSVLGGSSNYTVRCYNPGDEITVSLKLPIV